MAKQPIQLDRTFRGNLPIVPTPFDESGALALGDVPRLVDYYERCGVEGLTILGVMGEADKLSSRETEALVAEFLRVADGRFPVLVGVSSPNLALSVELALFAADRGSAGVMLMPKRGLKTDDAMVDYFERFAGDTGNRVLICAQDDPPVNDVAISHPAWCRISRIDAVRMLKHEPVPGHQKLSRILAAQAAGEAAPVSVLTSNNGIYLPQELARGCHGAMVGVAHQDAIVQICNLYWGGSVAAAFDLHDALLPLIRHEKQAVFGLALRKELMRQRGAMSTNVVRYPGVELTAEDIAELDVVRDRFEARLRELRIDLPAAAA